MSLVDVFGPGIWKRGGATILAASSEIIDIVAESEFQSIFYHMSIYNKSEPVTKFLDMTIGFKNSGLISIVKNKAGDSINFELSEATNSGNMELTLTNNEAYELVVQFAKLELGQ